MARKLLLADVEKRVEKSSIVPLVHSYTTLYTNPGEINLNYTCIYAREAHHTLSIRLMLQADKVNGRYRGFGLAPLPGALSFTVHSKFLLRIPAGMAVSFIVQRVFLLIQRCMTFPSPYRVDWKKTNIIFFLIQYAA